MDSKDTTREEESKADLRATEKEAALKVSKRDTGRREEEKEVVTRERALNAEEWATKRRSAWCTWLGRRALNAKRRRRSAK